METPDKNTPVSVRKYADLRGCSHTAVNKAIEAGKIKQALVFIEGREFPKIIPAVADLEWVATVKQLEQKPEYADQEPGELLPGEITLVEATRRAAVAKMERAELELAEYKKTLVNAEAVYKTLFAAGQELRAAILGVPDRNIDEIRAAVTRNEAATILDRALVEALESLSKLADIELTTD